jgi:polysaccharide deacetylase 2 family uncharacterized protein YibQ
MRVVVNRDIDRPLGQTPGRKPSRIPLPGRRGLFTIAGAVAIAGASVALVAFRDNPFGTTPPAAVAQAEAADETPAASVPAAPPVVTKAPEKGAGPAIIKVAREESANGGAIVIRDPSSVGQDTRVAHLPDRALIEYSEQGPLPVRGADGRRPVDVYARPWSGARGARIAIVIGGLSLSQTGTQEAIAALPSEVTLAFAPQGNSIDRWMHMARREGHEIVMQVPLEPFDYPNVNPGRNTLTVEASPEDNLRNLRWALGRTTNYTGVMNYMGARFSAAADAMAPVMAELGERGLLYLDDGSSARSLAGELAQGNAVPFASSDIAIDAVRERGEILKKLDELERIARAKGYAVGHGSAFDVTVSAVAAWVEEAKKRGIEIVPVSALAFDPERG